MKRARPLAVAAVLAWVAVAGIAGVGPLADVTPSVDGLPGDVAAPADRPSDDRSTESEATSDGSAGSGSNTGGSTGDATGDAGAAAGTEEPPPFSMSIAGIEECGRTCRDVSLRVTNERNRTATGVVVSASIYAGNDTDGDPIWEGERTVGSLDPGASVTVTERVDLGFVAAARIEEQGGWVTVVTTVSGADGSATFTDREEVA